MWKTPPQTTVEHNNRHQQPPRNHQSRQWNAVVEPPELNHHGRPPSEFSLSLSSIETTTTVLGLKSRRQPSITGSLSSDHGSDHLPWLLFVEIRQCARAKPCTRARISGFGTTLTIEIIQRASNTENTGSDIVFKTNNGYEPKLGIRQTEVLELPGSVSELRVSGSNLEL